MYAVRIINEILVKFCMVSLYKLYNNNTKNVLSMLFAPYDYKPHLSSNLLELYSWRQYSKSRPSVSVYIKEGWFKLRLTQLGHLPRANDDVFQRFNPFHSKVFFWAWRETDAVCQTLSISSSDTASTNEYTPNQSCVFMLCLLILHLTSIWR